MKDQANQLKSLVLESVGITFAQIIFTVCCYSCHSKYLKNESSFLFSILVPGLAAFLANFWIFRSSRINYIKLIIVFVLVSTIFEAISLYLGIMFFGE